MNYLKQHSINKWPVFALAMLSVSQLSVLPVMAEEIVELTNGDKINSLHADLNGSLLFSISVPEGSTDLKIKTNEYIPPATPFSCFGDGGSYSYCNGDSVLYVKQGSIPTVDDYDCIADDDRFQDRKNEAECLFSNPEVDTYFIRMYANTDFYSASIEASYKGLSSVQTYSANNLSLAQGQWLEYYIDIPAGITQLKVEMSGGRGDADLYAFDESGEFECYPWLTGNNETCTFNNPSAVRWSIAVHGYTAASGVNLKVTLTP